MEEERIDLESFIIIIILVLLFLFLFLLLEVMTYIIAVVVSKEVVIIVITGICMSRIDSEGTQGLVVPTDCIKNISLLGRETLWGSSGK